MNSNFLVSVNYNRVVLTCALVLSSLYVKCQNTTYGVSALNANTSGSQNTALGQISLYNNTSGSFITGIGYSSSWSNTIANFNTANGYSALHKSTKGISNTSTGHMALASSILAGSNTASGVNALLKTNSGASNSGFGVSALRENTSGNFNTAVGVSALRANTLGNENTAFGYQALYENLTGSSNTAIGYKANVAASDLTNATSIGANAIALESNAIQLGDAMVTEIYAGTQTNTIFITGTVQLKAGGSGVGKVLISDASGNGWWQLPTRWIRSGSDIRYTAGMVSIGTDLKPSGYKLAVGGKMLGEGLDIKLKSTWPDFVFEGDYQLLPLAMLEKQIRSDKHLPDVPSAQEINSEGLNVGEMSAVLLKKIEELTLYTIELQKKILSQQCELKSLKKEH